MNDELKFLNLIAKEGPKFTKDRHPNLNEIDTWFRLFVKQRYIAEIVRAISHSEGGDRLIGIKVVGKLTPLGEKHRLGLIRDKVN